MNVPFALQFFMVISDGLGGVARFAQLCNNIEFACYTIVNLTKNVLLDEFNIAFEMFSEVIVSYRNHLMDMTTFQF